MPRVRTTLAEDLAAARAAVPEMAAGAARVIAAIRDPKTMSSLPGWNVADIAVHLGLATGAYAEAVDGGLDVAHWDTIVPEHPDLQQRVAVLNATTLADAAPDEYRKAPGQIRDAASRMVAALEGREAGEPCHIPWFGGVTEPLTVGGVAGLFLSETVLHTLDIARATGQRWTVPPAIARLVISLAYVDTIPRTVDAARAANLHAAVRIHVRGGATIGVDVDGPQVLTVRDPAPAPADCHISVDAAAFILAVSGRSPLSRQIATGRVLAYGRKPWLGVTIAKLFVHP